MNDTGDSNSGEPKVPAPAKRRWWLWGLVVIIAVCAAALVAFLAALGSQANRAVARAREEAKAKGYATSLEEFYARQGPLSDEANAALIYEKAAIALAASGGEESATRDAPFGKCVPYLDWWLWHVQMTDPQVAQAQKDVGQMELDPRTPMPGYMLAASKYYVEKRRDVAELIGQARKLPSARYANAFTSPEIRDPLGKPYNARDPNRYLRASWSFARLMVLSAWVDAEEGRASQAVADVRDNLAIARSLVDESRLGSAHTAMLIASVALNAALPRVLARTDPSNEDLAGLETDLKRFNEELSERRWVEQALAWSFDFYEEVKSGKRAPREAYMPSWYLRLRPDSPRALWVDRNLSGVLVGFLKRDIVMQVRYYLWALDYIDGSPRPFYYEWNPLSVEVKNGRYIMTEREMVNTPQIILLATETRARLRAAAAASAALRFRNDHGKWPDSLDSLVPAYIDKVPIDPFTGKRLIYKIAETGIAVYSVGDDGIDNGGKGHSDAVYSGGDDAGIRVWK